MQQQNYPKHYCGVFGIFGHPNAAELAYYGLYALQHRGQESAGIVTCHDGKFFKHHGMGLVPQIFNDPKILHDLVGDMAIGHTRYSTTGSSQSAQRPAAHGGLRARPDRRRPQRQPDQRRQACATNSKAAASFSRPPWTAKSSS